MPDHPKHLRYLVDNDLSPALAKALKAVAFECTYVKETFPEYPDGSVDDGIILEYCLRTQTIWITSDEKREKLMKKFPSETSKVTLLLLKAPTKFPAWAQLKIVVRVLDEMERIVRAAHGGIHFKAAQKGRSTPNIVWAEHTRDRPKQF